MHIVELFFVVDIKVVCDRSRKRFDVFRFFGKGKRLAEAGAGIADDIAVHIDAPCPCIFVHVAVRPDRGQYRISGKRYI